MPHSFKLGLVVHAVGLPDELGRLIESLGELGSVMDSVRCCFITEKNFPVEDMTKLNVAAARNAGIRELLSDCDGIVCIDADYIISPGIFELLMEPAVQDFHVWIRRRDIKLEDARPRKWREWLSLPVFTDCWGSLTYLSKKNWLRLGGFDQRCVSWGAEDDICHIRIGQLGIERRRIDAFPLMHIAHGVRPFGGVNARGQENLKWVKVPQPNYLKGEA
jgi:glycosyltransferase involved in cell wall biosynthesis